MLPADRCETVRSVGYITIRSVLAIWGLGLCGMAIGSLVFHDVVYSEQPRPLEPGDFVLAGALFAMGMLHVLPFGWMAQHSRVRLALQTIVFLLLARLLAGVLVMRRPGIENWLWLAMLAIPPIVASWLIARHRLRQRAATA